MSINPPRFPVTTAKRADARRYYRERAVQLLHLGWSWDGRFRSHPWGVEVVLVSPDGVDYRSAFVLSSEAGKGHYGRWVESSAVPIVTSNACARVKHWLAQRKIPHADAPIPSGTAYRKIERFLRGRVENSDRLDEYFQEWFAALGISEERYAEWVEEISRRSGQLK